MSQNDFIFLAYKTYFYVGHLNILLWWVLSFFVSVILNNIIKTNRLSNKYIMYNKIYCKRTRKKWLKDITNIKICWHLLCLCFIMYTREVCNNLRRYMKHIACLNCKKKEKEKECEWIKTNDAPSYVFITYFPSLTID